MDKQLVQTIKAQHPAWELIQLTAHVKGASGLEKYEVIARVPDGAITQMFRDLIQQGPAGKARSVSAYVRACIVHPKDDALEELLDKRPGLVESWFGVLQERAGATEQVDSKNL